MKTLIKKLIPESWSQDIFHSYLAKMSISERATFKENLNLVGEMDYPDQPILMTVDTFTQFSRLGACKKEPETVHWLSKNIRESDVFYDIGANVGAYSFVACAITNKNCKTYAFEPSFTTYAALSRNVFLNQYTGIVVPLHIALGDKTDLLQFHYSSITAGASMHGLEEPVAEEGKPFQAVYAQPVISYRMDDMIHDFKLPSPNIIKIDVDGAELRVLQGAEMTFANPGLRTVLIELDEATLMYAEIVQRMKDAGFELSEKHQRGNSTYYNYIYHRT